MEQENKLFVGNLAYEVTNEQLKQFFADAGFNVVDAVVIIDKMRNRSKGFGFVTVSSPEEVEKAIAALNGQDLGGRAITVNAARPRADRPQQAA